MRAATLAHQAASNRVLSGGVVRAVLRYGACVLAVALAWLVRWALDPFLGNVQAFAFFYAAIALTAWWVGWQPAMLALVLGYLAGHWFFLPPRHALWLENFADVMELATYFSVGSTIILLSTLLHRAERQARTSARIISEEKRALEREMEERQRAVSALSESEQRFRAVFDQAPIAICLHTLEGRLFHANRVACNLFGLSREELCRLNIQDLVFPEDWPLTDELLPALVAGDLPLYAVERRCVRADGSMFWGRVDVSSVRDMAGKPSYIIGALVNTTERKQAEEVLARDREELERLVQERTVKLQETIGDLEHFSYSITHDMRAPLRAMRGYATLLEEECAGCTRARGLEFFRRIRTASERMDHLIQDSLNYTKILREELPLRPVDLSQLLRGIVESYPNLHPDAAEICLQGELPTVLGNEAGLTHCLANLLGNAVKFVAPGTKPRVRVWAEEVPVPASKAQSRETCEEGRGSGVASEVLSLSGNCPAQAQPASTMSPTACSAPAPGPSSPSVRLWIEDNGVGIPKEAQERIFGMFQRLHRDDEYPGTGIGLAIVRKAVQRMRGSVGVESECGKGSRFWVRLPKAS